MMEVFWSSFGKFSPVGWMVVAVHLMMCFQSNNFVFFFDGVGCGLSWLVFFLGIDLPENLESICLKSWGCPS